jgi:hypothetical protein
MALTVTTNVVTAITSNSATGGGMVSGGTVTSRGVVWNTSPNPTTGNSKTVDGGLLPTFTSHLTGLLPSTTYYVRAYGHSTGGTTYGNQVSFHTIAAPLAITSDNFRFWERTDIFNGSPDPAVQIAAVEAEAIVLTTNPIDKQD